jgi:predicted phosphodiesterase
MRQLLLSDIHSNMEAFNASMERAEKAGYDSVLCCGDIVGIRA